MREVGTVVDVEGHRVTVRMQPGPQCGSCCACATLGGGERELEVTAADPPPVGAHVVVEVSTPNAALGALLIFGLPLLGLVGGVLIGHHLQPFGLSGDADGLVLGFGLLVLVFAGAAALDRLVLRPRLPKPQIVRVLDQPQP